jgi:Ca-activated chloride channel family protein
VTFAETAQVDLAPTPDRAALRRAVERMDLRAGTGIGEAIFASLDALATVGAIAPLPGSPLDGAPPTTAAPLPRGDAPARIVVMSDGETTMGRPNELATRAAAAAGVPVWTIAFGTSHGTISYEGQTVMVPTNAPALAQVARATGGQSFEAASESELLAVFSDVGVTVDTEEVERDLAPWFTGAGLLLVAAAGVLSLVWFQRLV